MPNDYPSEEEIWQWRSSRAWVEWGRVTGIPDKSIGAYLRRRGWAAKAIRRGKGEGTGAKGSRIIEAPCSECYRKNIPVEDLTDDRLCHKCDIARQAREAAPVDLEAEREAYLQRRREEYELLTDPGP